MNKAVKNVAVLGSTGSVGCNTLAVIEASEGRLQACALSAHQRLADLEAQATQHRPRWLIASNSQASARYDWKLLPSETELMTGAEGIAEVVSKPEVDIVVAAIVGSAGLQGTWAALEAGKPVALANKETLVVAGAQVMELSKAKNAPILPVDSEHSAIFQALRAGQSDEVERIVLTASGGPFRKHTLQQLQTVTVEEALNHPTWEMGEKITVDSATMMNKALEIIEARWLFDLPPEKIAVMIHPQSQVHSFVEFKDGSVMAQISPPDMKMPIEYALNFPQRLPGIAAKLDWGQAMQLDFIPPDRERFPALDLGHEVAAAGGTAGVVVNAANEAAVAAFLKEEMRFIDIVAACKAVLDQHDFDPNPSLSELDRWDAWARQEVMRWNRS